MQDAPRITIDWLTPEDAATELAAVLSRDALDQAELDFLLLSLAENAKAGDRIERTPDQPARRLLRRRVANTHIYVDVSRAALMSAALLLDAFATKGIAIGALTAAGYASQCIAYLSPKTGAFCNFLTVESDLEPGTTITPAEIAAATSGNVCPHHRLDCMHRSEKVCSIAEQSVRQNIAELERQNVVTVDLDGVVRRKGR